MKQKELQNLSGEKLLKAVKNCSKEAQEEVLDEYDNL